jgi:predicted transcriptional regulator
MHEKTIKIDEPTERLVAELAYFLRSTKKSIVREAVADFAAARGRGDANSARDAGASARAAGHERFDQLPLIERLTLRRSELIRAFAEHGATNIRVLGPMAVGEDADEFELLAETDLLRGSWSAPELQMIAARLLGAPTTVVSSTNLRLFSPDRLRRALEESRPL